MTFGERLYLALVLIAFIAFANTLAVVAYRSGRFLQRKGRTESHPPEPRDELTQEKAT
jgi:hypothetical protein